MKRWTPKQLRVALVWIENHSHKNYYEAQTASEVRRGWVEKPNMVKTDDFILKRKKKGQPQLKKLTNEELASFAKARLMVMLAGCDKPLPVQNLPPLVEKPL